jgi:hypothetical protein
VFNLANILNKITIGVAFIKDNEILMENKAFLKLMTNGVKTNVLSYLNMFEDEKGHYTINQVMKQNCSGRVFRIVPREGSIFSNVHEGHYTLKITKGVRINQCKGLTMVQIMKTSTPDICKSRILDLKAQMQNLSTTLHQMDYSLMVTSVKLIQNSLNMSYHQDFEPKFEHVSLESCLNTAFEICQEHYSDKILFKQIDVPSEL